MPSLVTWVDFCEGKPTQDGRHCYALGLVRGAFPSVKLDDRFLDSHEILGFDEKYDLIHIAGDHTIEGCLKDLKLAARSLTPRGHIICHDSNCNSVLRAIATFCVFNEDFRQFNFNNVYQGLNGLHRVDEHLDSCPIWIVRLCSTTEHKGRTMKKEMTIAVPAGIGDVSWILSKLVNVTDKWEFNVEVADGAPYRTVPFLRMFPWIKAVRIRFIGLFVGPIILGLLVALFRFESEERAVAKDPD